MASTTASGAAIFSKSSSNLTRKSSTSTFSDSSSSTHSARSENTMPRVQTPASSISSGSNNNNHIYNIDDFYKIIQVQQTTINKLSQEVGIFIYLKQLGEKETFLFISLFYFISL